MKITVENFEPFAVVTVKDKLLKNTNIKCVIDTWFTWFLTVPYFVWKWEKSSVVNNFKFLKSPIELPKSKWIETASWKVRSYLWFIWFCLWNHEYESEIFIYESNMPYSPKRDVILLWMEFLEINFSYRNF